MHPSGFLTTIRWVKRILSPKRKPKSQGRKLSVVHYEFIGHVMFSRQGQWTNPRKTSGRKARDRISQSICENPFRHSWHQDIPVYEDMCFILHSTYSSEDYNGLAGSWLGPVGRHVLVHTPKKSSHEEMKRGRWGQIVSYLQDLPGNWVRRVM